VAWRMATGHVCLWETGLLVQCRRACLPAARDDLRYGKAIASVSDGGGEDFVERQLAEAVVELGPTVDAAGDGHAERSAAGNELQVALLELVEREAAGTAAAGVETVEFFSLRVPDDREQVAAR